MAVCADSTDLDSTATNGKQIVRFSICFLRFCPAAENSFVYYFDLQLSRWLATPKSLISICHAGPPFHHYWFNIYVCNICIFHSESKERKNKKNQRTHSAIFSKAPYSDSKYFCYNIVPGTSTWNLWSARKLSTNSRLHFHAGLVDQLYVGLSEAIRGAAKRLHGFLCQKRRHSRQGGRTQGLESPRVLSNWNSLYNCTFCTKLWEKINWKKNSHVHRLPQLETQNRSQAQDLSDLAFGPPTLHRPAMVGGKGPRPFPALVTCWGQDFWMQRWKIWKSGKFTLAVAI